MSASSRNLDRQPQLGRDSPAYQGPWRRLKADPADRESTVLFDTDDVAGSQGVLNAEFHSLEFDGGLRIGEDPHDALDCEPVGVKKNAKGARQTWVGYKLHVDAADGGVPVSCLLTSASLHDSQAAIPLACLTAGRVDNPYDLMDAAYDADEIRAYSRDLGHAAIIDLNPRRSL